MLLSRDGLFVMDIFRLRLASCDPLFPPYDHASIFITARKPCRYYILRARFTFVIQYRVDLIPTAQALIPRGSERTGNIGVQTLN